LIHYPVPVHLQPAYVNLGCETGSLPNSEKAASEVLSLPLYPELSEADVRRVAEVILEFLGQDEN
jgi:dTDP-4-amino-4,6-dideoxygalactose transaminase